MSDRSIGVEVLGCNATAPDSTGPASGYVLHGDDGVVLVDAGPGTMAAYTARYPLSSIRGIVVTHMHADHSLDLMAWAYRWTFPEVLPAVPLLLPKGSESLLERFDELYGIPTLPTMHAPIRQSFDVTWMTMDGVERFDIAGWSLTPHEARHAVPSAALRFERAGAVVAFSSDTGDCPGVRAAAVGADLFISEATWNVEPGGESAGHGHLTATEAGTIAATAAVQTLLVTHLADRSVETETVRLAKEAFPGGSVVLARPGMRF